jgi:hypothetical protein
MNFNGWVNIFSFAHTKKKDKSSCSKKNSFIFAQL